MDNEVVNPTYSPVGWALRFFVGSTNLGTAERAMRIQSPLSPGPREQPWVAKFGLGDSHSRMTLVRKACLGGGRNGR